MDLKTVLELAEDIIARKPNLKDEINILIGLHKSEINDGHDSHREYAYLHNILRQMDSLSNP